MIEGPSFNIGMTQRLNIFALLDKQMLENGSKIFYTTAVTLDSMKLNNCDMIKIDAEGEEKNVLKGAKDTIKKFSPHIIVDS